MNGHYENYTVRGVASLLVLNVLVASVVILRVDHMYRAGVSELVVGIMLVVLCCVVANYAFVAGALLLGKIELRNSMWILTPAVVSHVAILAAIANTARDILTFVGIIPPIVTAIVIAFTLQRTALNK